MSLKKDIEKIIDEEFFRNRNKLFFGSEDSKYKYDIQDHKIIDAPTKLNISQKTKSNNDLDLYFVNYRVSFKRSIDNKKLIENNQNNGDSKLIQNNNYNNKPTIEFRNYFLLVDKTTHQKGIWRLHFLDDIIHNHKNLDYFFGFKNDKYEVNYNKKNQTLIINLEGNSYGALKTEYGFLKLSSKTKYIGGRSLKINRLILGQNKDIVNS